MSREADFRTFATNAGLKADGSGDHQVRESLRNVAKSSVPRCTS